MPEAHVCPCCDVPFEYTGGKPRNPYSWLKLDAITGEILFVGDHGFSVSDIDSDGTYLYMCSVGNSVLDGARVRKVRADNGEPVWAFPSGIQLRACTLGINGLLVGGDGITGTSLGTGSGSGSGTSGIPYGKDINLLDYTTGEVIWNAYLNPNDTTVGSVQGIAIDTSGNVYACGSIAGTTVGAATRWCLVKFDQNGIKQWTKTGIQTSGNAVFNAIWASSSFVNVTGLPNISPDNNPGTQIWTFDFSGNLIDTFPTTSMTMASRVAICNLLGGNTLCAGPVLVPTLATLARVDQFGTGASQVIWTKYVDTRTGGTSFGAADINDIVIDESDNIYLVTARETVSGPNNYTIWKFTPDTPTIAYVWRTDAGLHIQDPANSTAFGISCAYNSGYLYVGSSRVTL